MMKLLLCLVLSILSFAVVTARPNITLNALDWSTISTNAGSPLFPVVTAKDLLVYYDLSAVDNSEQVERGLPSPSGQPVMAIRRRNAEGVYVHVGNFTGFGSFYATTNGKWVAVFGMGVALFSVDENNTISEVSFVPAAISEGFLLSDDTFVAYLFNSPMDDGNYTIKSYQYESSNNTWNEIAGTEVVINYRLDSLPGITPYQVTDTHLVVMDPNNMAANIFERQANKSWNLIDSVPVNNSSIGVNYNGLDTITCFTPFIQNGQSIGVLFVYTKINGKWTEQMFDAAGVGLRPVGLLGVKVSFLNANTLLVSVPYEGVASLTELDSLPTSGRIVVMTRNSTGLWEPSADLIGPGLFGLGIGVNDYDIVVPSLFPFMSQSVSLKFQTLPRCFNQPINVTCADEQANDCSGIDFSSLYTINDAQCGAVETTFDKFSLINNNAIRAHLSFSRAGASVSCNVTVTCPSAPTFVQQQTPTGNAVSSAVGFELGLSLLAPALAMFL